MTAGAAVEAGLVLGIGGTPLRRGRGPCVARDAACGTWSGLDRGLVESAIAWVGWLELVFLNWTA